MKTAFEQEDGSVKWIGYQDLPGITGERKVEARRLFIENDFKDASVLDLGCWGGQMMLEAKRMGAKEVLGIEIDTDAVKIGRSLGLDIEVDDLESPLMWKELKRYDVVLCLAILGNMKNQVAVLSNASQITDIMYVEGHGIQHKFSREDWVNLFLTYTTFKNIEYLGNIDTRPFFRLSRKEVDIDYIKRKNYKKIAIIGKPGVGKTHFTQFFKDYTIFSDKTEINGDKIVVDSHGALTLDKYDCVINIVSDRKVRVERLVNREKVSETNEDIENFIDTISPHYIKGDYDFYTIIN